LSLVNLGKNERPFSDFPVENEDEEDDSDYSDDEFSNGDDTRWDVWIADEAAPVLSATSNDAATQTETHSRQVASQTATELVVPCEAFGSIRRSRTKSSGKLSCKLTF
jgi:hypothetical protein